MSGPRPLSSVDQVRDELRRLGYLDTGLDRFVLGGAGTRSPLRASLAVALRVGLAGGAVLGGCLIAGAAALEPRLVTEPADLLVLATSLLLVAGLASALLGSVGGLVAFTAARRPGRTPGPALTKAIAAGVTLGSLVYAGLWWGSHVAGAAVWVQVTAAVVGVGLSLLGGRLAWLSVVAVLSAGGVAEAPPRAELARRRLLAVLASAALLVAGGVGAASIFGSGAPPPSDLAVVPTGLRVRVLGVDGLDPAMVEELRRRGELGNLARLLEGGAHWRLAAEPEAAPATVWTTYATGRGPEAHGIRASAGVRLAGTRSPASPPGPILRGLQAAADLLEIGRGHAAASRPGAPAFWSVAARNGLGVGIVSWRATWPVEPVDGYLVSDRAFFTLERGGLPNREVHPPEALADLVVLHSGLEGDLAERLDRFPLAVSHRLRDAAEPDLEAVYLPGLDVATVEQLGGNTAGDLAGLARRLDRVRAHYRFFDARLGELLDSLGERDVLLLVGDPGRFARRAPLPPEGLLVMAGPVVEPGDHGVATGRDVAPTVLHLCGLPLSRELGGRALVAGLTADFRERHPLRSVSSYGSRGRERAAPPSSDEPDVDGPRGSRTVP